MFTYHTIDGFLRPPGGEIERWRDRIAIAAAAAAFALRTLLGWLW